jgi:IS4 transposase
VDIEVFVGKEKQPVRLVACLLSEEAINKRQREANRSAQRHGSTISKKKANLLKYGIFITNVPVTMLSSISIMATYRARWRVELIFKQWKSCLKIHLFKGTTKNAFTVFYMGG